MKNILKTIVLSLFIIGSAMSADAMSITKLDNLIEGSELNETSSIAVSIRNAKTGNIVYKRNEKKLLHPASTLKLFTAYAAADTLGYDYKFKTQFYKSGNDLYIKLGADPLLTSAQLQAAFKELKSQNETSFKNLYFDDSIIDSKEFPQGWMYDDDVSPYTPKISAYNLDGNVIKAELSPAGGNMMNVILHSKYPMSVVSNIRSAAEDSLEMARYNWNNPDLTMVWGTVNKTQSFNIPISSMRRYFIFNINEAIEDSKIQITGTRYSSRLVPDDAELLTEISNPLTSVLASALKNSNNLYAETIYKLAASKKYKSTGSDELGSEMFGEFYNNLNLDTNGIIIKDGCGVSRNNLFSADWMSEALVKLYKDKDFEKFREYAAKPGEGTLSNRLFDLRGDAELKTGSLSNASGISGWIKSQDGRTYAVTVLIQNFKQKQSEIKKFEDEIIRIIYNK